MRRRLFRLIVLLPPAALMTAVLLGSTSSLVSALESSLNRNAMPAVTLASYSTACEMLAREFPEVSRVATSCSAGFHCTGSKSPCPIAMDEDERREGFDRPWSERARDTGVPTTFVF